jgi:hypothetical protein
MFRRSCDVQGRGWLYFDRGSSESTFGSILFIIVIDMVLLFYRIWDYVYLQRCHSFVIFVYLNYMCGIVQVYLVIGLSFQLVDCAICVSCVKYMFSLS